MLCAWYSIGQSLLRGLDRPSGIIMSTSVLHKQRARWCLGFFCVQVILLASMMGFVGLLRAQILPFFFLFFFFTSARCLFPGDATQKLSPPQSGLEVRMWRCERETALPDQIKVALHCQTSSLRAAPTSTLCKLPLNLTAIMLLTWSWFGEELF